MPTSQLPSRRFQLKPSMELTGAMAMSKWFEEKVGHLVREAPRLSTSTQQGPKSVEELSAELESQAKRVSGPSSATELVQKWAEKIDSNQGLFLVGGEGSSSLSFFEALLKSRALELLLEACARVPSLRTDLSPGGEGEGQLQQPLQSLMNRVLLPGSLSIWPGLLEVLVGVDEKSRCASWAKRFLIILKRQWEREGVQTSLRALDRKLTTVVSKPAPVEDAEHRAAVLRNSYSGERVSKSGIRAALARDKLNRLVLEAGRLQGRAELLCETCACLEAAENIGTNRLPEVQSLLHEADEMLSALDDGVKELCSEQETLRGTLHEVGVKIKGQKAELQETVDSFGQKRARLQEEKASLLLRLEEVNMQIAQMDEALLAFDNSSKQLDGQLRDATHHYEGLIIGSFNKQKQLADEKLRAVACKACAHTGVDIVSSEERRRKTEIGVQLRRRRAELRRTCAAYLHQERLRMEAIAECAAGREAATSSSAPAQVQEPYEAARTMLQRCLPLLAGDPSSSPGGEASRAAAPVAPLEVTVALEMAAKKAPPEDALSFFAEEFAQGQICVDCSSPDADWASVSYGTYLCLDCAGRHRGLGVHLSFVRSTTMDIWTVDQLRRMQLGGSRRFQDFLRSYPKLSGDPHTAGAVVSRYSSRAACFYRQLLDALCQGADARSLAPPSAEEGHLPAGDSPTKRVGEGFTSEEDGDAVIGSLEEEQLAFEATFTRLMNPEPPPAILADMEPLGTEEQQVVASPELDASPELLAEVAAGHEEEGDAIPELSEVSPKDVPSGNTGSHSEEAAAEDETW